MSDRVNSYTGRYKRTSGPLVNNDFNPGPFVAIVRSHLDSKFMGNLEVELLTKTDAGNRTKKSGIITPVEYLSPFYSSTPYEGVSDNDGHEFSQKAAGMWFVPPDIGSRVLVIFAEGGQGFWMGCIQSEYANMMVPAGDAATTYNAEDQSKRLPVGEYNKKQEFALKNDPTKFIKPVNTDQLNILEIQGLLEDETRGITSSSARREVPSMVFGISTPGPYDRRPGAPQLKYGLIDDPETAKIFHNRLGGSSIVFDDGDQNKLREKPASEAEPVYVDKDAGGAGGDPTIPHNEMIRLKTRTGHKIIMHNSEDLIYITNSKGNAWVELTANGKIDIYSQDSISVHTENDLNFKADRDINLEAGRNYNLKANENIKVEAVMDRKITVGQNQKLTIGKNLDLSSGESNIISAGSNTEIYSGGNHIEETGGVIHMNGPSAKRAKQEPVFDTFSLPNNEDVIMKRVPQHEPWLQHENLNPNFYRPNITDRETAETPETAKYIPSGDTFRKGGS